MEIPEIYQIESVEQLRAASDTLRQRIMEPLSAQAMTATQVADLLGQQTAKIHYHIKELEKVGLLRQVETREKGGILEKYYRAAGRTITVAPTVLQALSPQENVSILGGFLETICGEFLAALGPAREGDVPAGLVLASTLYWATDEEHAALMESVQALFAPYQQPKEGARERVLAAVGYPARSVAEQKPATPVRRRVVVVGVVDYTRASLERRLDRGEVLDMTVWGLCRFAGDVSPDLVDRVVGSLHLRGRLQAPPAVRAVLERKERRTWQP